MPTPSALLASALRPLAGAARGRRRPAWLGSLDRTAPLGDHWGYDRGTPVDRWYIERFLERHRGDVTGRVLEVKDSGYTKRFGIAVSEAGVLDVDEHNPMATYVADLASGNGLPSDHFDCFILTQTLQYVFDLRAAIGQAHRTLRPGGTLLATLPVVSRIDDPPLPDYWRFTPLAVRRLFDEVFGSAAVEVGGRGSVLGQIAFLEGLAVEELDRVKVPVDDQRFPVVVTVRAIKALRR